MRADHDVDQPRIPVRPALRRLLATLGVGLAAALLAMALGMLPLVETLDWKLYDQRLRWTADPAAADPDIVLVTIDESSIRALEPLVGRWPWPRLLHAQVIDFLARGPARAVAYDVLFTERDRRLAFAVGDEQWSGAESDAVFARSVARAGNVVLAADATFEGRAGDEVTGPPIGTNPYAAVRLPNTVEERPAIAPPYEELATAARALGHNLFVLDPDGPVRRLAPFVRSGGQAWPSLGLAAALVAEQRRADALRVDPDTLSAGGRRLALLRERLPDFAAARTAPREALRALIAYRGPAVLADGKSIVYRTYSFYDLFYAEQQVIAGEPPDVDPAVFRDTVVFVGLTAAGLHDVFAVPFGATGKMPGPQVHASFADQWLAGRELRPVAVGPAVVLTIVVGLAVAWVMVAARVRISAPVTLLVAAALVAGSTAAFARGLVVPLAVPLLATTLAAFGGIAFRYFVEGREKRAVKRLFSRYLSRDVYEQVLANPALAELGGTRRDMTVLFSDIRGFTALTERGDPEALVAQLNEYFSRMVDVVFAHRGTLDKFVGDMVMALFGAPLDDQAHADHAVQAAIAMVRELEALNARWAAEGRPTLGIGIGVNSGEMIAGNIGAESIRSYTVIGDHVNLGARLESLNKDYRTAIIISGYTAEKLRGRYDLRPLGEVVVRGKSQPVGIFEVRTGTEDRGDAPR